MKSAIYGLGIGVLGYVLAPLMIKARLNFGCDLVRNAFSVRERLGHVTQGRPLARPTLGWKT
jgi:hypothetical protein